MCIHAFLSLAVGCKASLAWLCLRFASLALFTPVSLLHFSLRRFSSAKIFLVDSVLCLDVTLLFEQTPAYSTLFRSLRIAFAFNSDISVVSANKVVHSFHWKQADRQTDRRHPLHTLACAYNVEGK